MGALLIPLRIFKLPFKRLPVAWVDEEQRPNVQFWQALIAISMLYLSVGSFWFQHWYVLWALTPAVLLPDSQFTRLILPWLTFGALVSNVTMDFLLNTAMKTSPALVQYVLVVMIIWGPVLFVTAALALIRRTRKRTSLEQSLSY